ncbi:hypothetical protein AB1L42_01455 [Thalassoglobus sp. JC818]|uniref:hypothetical protein n=1 Tax=Thalassoglobus sp. JC818 TaxID=3232136 RepID=UPI003459BECB
MSGQPIGGNDSASMRFRTDSEISFDDASLGSYDEFNVAMTETHIEFDNGLDEGLDFNNFSMNDQLRSDSFASESSSQVKAGPTHELVWNPHLQGYQLQRKTGEHSSIADALKAFGNLIGDKIGSLGRWIDNKCGNFFTMTIPSKLAELKNSWDRKFGGADTVRSDSKLTASDLQSVLDLRDEAVQQTADFRAKHAVRETAGKVTSHLRSNSKKDFPNEVVDSINKTTTRVRKLLETSSQSDEISPESFQSEVSQRFNSNRSILEHVDRTDGLVEFDISNEFASRKGPLFDLLVNSYETAASARPGSDKALQWETTASLVAAMSRNPEDCRKTIDDLMHEEQQFADDLISDLSDPPEPQSFNPSTHID